MRKMLLVLLMVGASFAGGAVINSPDQTWSRDLLAQARHLAAGGLPIIKAEDAQGPAVVPEDEPVTDVPAAPTPRLSLIPEPTPSPELPEVASIAPDSKATGLPQISESPKPTQPSPDTGSKTMGDALSRVFLPRTTPRTGDSTGPTPATEPPRPADPPPPLRDPEVARAAVGRPSMPPASEPPSPLPASPPSRAEAGWDALMLRLKELGVRQYWLEGRPGGPVRLRCVLPTAGKAAVGPMFEAEADDEAHAAESVLKRIGQWKAAERP